MMPQSTALISKPRKSFLGRWSLAWGDELSSVVARHFAQRMVGLALVTARNAELCMIINRLAVCEPYKNLGASCEKHFK